MFDAKFAGRGRIPRIQGWIDVFRFEALTFWPLHWLCRSTLRFSNCAEITDCHQILCEVLEQRLRVDHVSLKDLDC